ncbi:MAG TPA: phosphatase PAP2 family protein [Pyrinomonadaceae bacterium]|nr:phosphatase PAP2 family protein [Pyrinomonadaceae bacterium]
MMNRLLESSVVRVLAGFALAAAILALLGWIVTGPYKQHPASFDAAIRYTMRQIQSPMWTTFFLAITKLGSTIYLAIIGSIAGIVFIAYRWFRSLLMLIVAMTGQAALHHGCKLFFARPRPPELINYPPVESFSFPSGHAVASLSLYFALAWIVGSRVENSSIKAIIWIVTAILVFLIGTSRVYIGVHYPTDVVAGFIAAIVWMIAVMPIDKTPL